MAYKYVVMVDGSGFELEAEELRGRKYGFTTTRYVEAENVTSAEAMAIASVKEELAARFGDLDETKYPMRAILVKELDEESEMFDVGGFTWSPEEDLQ